MHILTVLCPYSLQSVLSAKPRHTDGLHTLGMVYSDLGSYKKAKEMYKRVLNLSPSRADTLYQLARTLVHLNEHRSAAVKLKSLLKFDTGNRDARRLLESVEKYL